jgi:hypothetical protein
MAVLYTAKYGDPFIIDDDCVEQVQKHTWYITHQNFVRTNSSPSSSLLHLFLFGHAPKGTKWEFINGDKADCRHDNLKAVENAKRVSGVYGIRNLLTQKVYIGSATSIIGRYRTHLWKLPKRNPP